MYEQKQHISPGSIEKIKNRTVMISGFSKIFYIAGWRIGYLACNETWAAAAGQFDDLVYICPPSPLQEGIAGGIAEIGDEYFEKTRINYEKKTRYDLRGIGPSGIDPVYTLMDPIVCWRIQQLLPERRLLKRQCIFWEKPMWLLFRAMRFMKMTVETWFGSAKEDLIIEKACKQIIDGGGHLDGASGYSLREQQV